MSTESQAVTVKLNLASQPFGRTRLYWTAVAFALAALLGVAAVQIVVFLRNRDLPPGQVARETELRSQLVALHSEQAALQSKLREPGNEQVLARSLFVNELLFRKGVSWTRTFADLEQVLPPRVRMLMIRPQLEGDQKILLDMQVAAEKPEDFIEFLHVMEKSDYFGAPSLRNWNPPTDEDPSYRYQLTVSYDQEL